MLFIRIEKLCVIIFYSFCSYSQPTEWMDKLYVKERKTNNTIPNTITKTKSIVFYSSPKIKNKKELEKLHNKFLNTNIDVVNYIYFQDYLINKETKESFVEYFIQREIKHVVFYSFKSNNKEEIFLCFFNNKKTLVDTKKDIWYKKGEGVFKDLEKTMLKNKFQEGNFLPSPYPEPIEKIKTKIGKIIIAKKPQLTKEKLGVVLFQKIEDEKQKNKEVTVFNKKTEAKNKKLKEIFLEYKNNHEFIEEKEDTRFYFTRGVKYILRIIFARKELIEKHLNVEIKNTPPKQLGYFVFLQHSFSKTIFLDKSEKIYLNWEDAMVDFIKKNQPSKL